MFQYFLSAKYTIAIVANSAISQIILQKYNGDFFPACLDSKHLHVFIVI